MRASELVELAEEGWRQWLLADPNNNREPVKRDYVYASQRRECTRRSVYEMTTPEALPKFDADTLARFRRGNDRERDMLIDLRRIGRATEPQFEIIGEQETFKLEDRKGRKTISGKIDGRIRLVGETGKGSPLEVKSWSVNITVGIKRFDDLFSNQWTSAGAHQLLMYMLGLKESQGFLLLDRPGVPILLPVELEEHLERAEEFWAQAEQAVAHVHEPDKIPIPDFINEPSVCKMCPFYGAVCNPPSLSSGDMQIITDEYQLERIQRFRALRKVLRAAGLEEYVKLDKSLKEDLRGVEMALAGDALIKGKWGKMSRVELPAMLAAEWEAIKLDYTKTDPKGKFTLKIEDLDNET